MLHVLDNGSIKLTRGDTARLNVSIKNTTLDEDYEIAADDVLTLTVKKTVNDSEPLVQKAVTGSASFKLEPADTASLAYGKYKYDVQLATAAGDVYTVIEPSTFEITSEVTW